MVDRLCMRTPSNQSPVYDTNGLALDVSLFQEFHHLGDLAEAVENLGLGADVVSGDDVQHLPSRVTISVHGPLDGHVPQHDVLKGDRDLLGLGGLDDGAVRAGDGDRKGGGGRVVTDVDGRLDPEPVRGEVTNLGHDARLGLTGVQDVVRPRGTCDLEPRVPRVDGDDVDPLRLCEPDPEVAQAPSRPDDGQPPSRLDPADRQGPVDGQPGAGQRGRGHKRHGVGHDATLPGVRDVVLGEGAVGFDPGGPVALEAVLTPVPVGRGGAVDAFPARV